MGSTTVIENPAAIMLAYRYAEHATGSPRLAQRTHRAYVRWADGQGGPILGGANADSLFSGALAVAEVYGVGGPFLDGVAAVVEDAALEQASQDVGTPATETDEEYLSAYLDTLKAAATGGKDALKRAYEAAMHLAPSEVAKRAVDNATKPYVEALGEAAESTKAILSKVYEDQKTLPSRFMDFMNKQAGGLVVWGVAATIVAGTVAWAMFGPKR